MHLSDEHLNYWGEIYFRANLLDYEVPFAVFVRNPWDFFVQFGVQSEQVLTVAHGREVSRDTGRPARLGSTARVEPAKIYSIAEARTRRQLRRAASSSETV